MNRNLSRNCSREHRPRPDRNRGLTIMLKLEPRDHELLESILRDRGCSCEDIFRIGMDDLIA